MMGRSHAVSGMTAGLVLFSHVSLTTPHVDVGSVHLDPVRIPLSLGIGHMPVAFVAAASLVLAVTVLLPDIDTTKSYAATALPGVTTAVSSLVSRGGHRTWTHVAAGVAVASAAAYALSFWTMTYQGMEVRPGLGIVFGLGVAMAARALGVSPRLFPVLWTVFGFGFGMGMLCPAPPAWYVPTLVAVGMLVHRIGDRLTTQDTPPLLWPLQKKHLVPHVAVLGDAGSRREDWLRRLMYVYIAYALVSILVG